jgi:hypothetical protein
MFGFLFAALVLYLGAGAVFSWYESSQTDEPFSVNLMLTWPKRFIKK